MSVETGELKAQIKQAGYNLGNRMSEVLPHRPSWFAWVLRGHLFTEKALIRNEQGGENDTFVRAWLERDPALKPDVSTVTLLTDQVMVDKTKEDQSHQFGVMPLIAARYSERSGLELHHDLGSSQQEILDRIEVLGSYVDAIAEAVVHKQLRRAVPVHRLKFRDGQKA